MPKSLAALLLLLLCLLPGMRLSAQHPDDEYYPYAEPEERPQLLRTDSALFYRAVQTPDDLYGTLTRFDLPQVALKRRGQPFARERIHCEGIAIGYRHAAALLLAGAAERNLPGIGSDADAAGSAGGLRNLRFPQGEPLRPYRASVRITDRNYNAGARFTAERMLARGWKIAAGADLRTGRDLRIEGVFTHAATLALRIERSRDDANGLSLTLAAPLTMQGTRLSSTEEAFALTGDRLYNPAWGFQRGKVRNSRVRREGVPLLLAAWHRKVSPATSFAATLGAEAGLRKYSALGWYDARTPMPDHYRYLPSFTGDRAAGEAWRRGDAAYTQIRWDELIAQNRMQDGEALYTVEDRVERIGDLHLNVRFATRVEPRLVLHYGIRLDGISRRHYKQMRDLLGARRLTDIDQYLMDDDAYGTRRQNDLRHPFRQVGRGDRFGYDYTLATRSAEVRLRAEYRADRLRADVDLAFGSASVRRRGHYEKELFPGKGSYGPSRRLGFAPYTLKAVVGHSFTPRHYVQLAATATAGTPDAADLFYQPLYNNRTIDTPKPERIYGAQLDYRTTGPRLDLHLSLFVTATFDGCETRRYYDDMAAAYCDAAVTGIATAAYGVEAAAEWRIARRWRLSLAASAGRYRFIRDPRVTILSDTDNTAVDIRTESHMGGCSVGGAPRLTAYAGIGYFGPRGWGFRASAGYAGGRYVEPAFIRRTPRIARQAGITPEAFATLTRQERLEDAFTLDAALFRTLRIGRSQLTAALSLRNLTGGSVPYAGYEALRIRTIRSGAHTLREPQATRYTYTYPRSFHLTVSYRF